MIIIVTGVAGFIGANLVQALINLNLPMTIVGLDNLNNYYSVDVKKDRIRELNKNKGFIYVKGTLEDYRKLEETFMKYKPETVINLAAQAGVRFSIENPRAYIDSNLVGFFNILQCCRDFPINHLIYASSSAVYGDNREVPNRESDNSDKPVSLYAATKKSEELMAYSYCKLYGVKASGLRFFTVYGPNGRPDMAYYQFAEKIKKGETIEVYNNGEIFRDFTYIDDVVEAVFRLLNRVPSKDENDAYHKIYNVGSGKPHSVNDMIDILEKYIGKKAIRKNLPMQKGDMFLNYAKTDELEKIISYKPMVDFDEGLRRFIEWLK
jgi:UDP-glucuronate 4-epimerase